jgi:hypothetical protein
MIKYKVLIFLAVAYLLLPLKNYAVVNSFFPLWKSPELKSIHFDYKYTPSQYEVNAVFFILGHSSEVHIHQMRGEDKNQVFVRTEKENGGYAEAVYDKNGDLVTSSYNEGSFNYYLYDVEPLKHFSADMLPWLVYGNAKDDPTSFNERLYYYLNDLDRGIQYYIFKGKPGSIENVSFDKLSKEDKMVIRFFCHLVFNKNFKIQLNEENREKLINDSDFYWSYFYQIQELLGYKK